MDRFAPSDAGTNPPFGRVLPAVISVSLRKTQSRVAKMMLLWYGVNAEKNSTSRKEDWKYC